MATIAPAMLALAIAVPALLDAPAARAGSCLSVAPNSYACAGVANPATDTTQSLSFSVNDTVSVGIADGFGHDTRTSGGTAIEVSTDPSAQLLSVQFDGAATIDGADHALDISFAGSNVPGFLEVTQNNPLQTVTLTGHGASHAALNIITTAATQIVSVDLPNSSLTGGREGVRVEHNGQSLVVVDVNNVTGLGGDAIDIDKTGLGPVGVGTTGIVDGALSGIDVNHSGQGDISIDAEGTVISRGAGISYAGIYAELSSNDGGSIDATASGNIEAQSTGVFLVNKGKGKTTFTLGDTTANTSADITGVGGGTARTAGNAIHVATDATAGTNITGDFAVEVTTVAGGKLQAGSNGIYINHGGDKGVKVVSNATIDATGKGMDIQMTAGANPGKLDVDVGGAITAGDWGVFAQTAGGDATIDVNAQVDAGSSGIGGGVGIIHSGSGNATITSTAAVIARGAGGTIKDVGLGVQHTGTGNVVITANAAVTANQSGIGVNHQGSGTVTVTTNAGGSVTSSNDDAIAIGAGNSVTAISVTTDDVVTSNNGDGITINYTGNGNATVHARKDVTSTANGDGIYIYHGNSNGNDSITTDATVSAAETGLMIDKGGDGTATITANGTVGGGQSGIKILRAGTGDATITANGAVFGNGTTATDVAIGIRHTGTGTITIAANGPFVGAENRGISATHEGTGGIDIDTTARIVAKGSDADDAGIRAMLTTANGTDIDVLARGDIEAKNIGVYLVNKGKGKTTFTLGDTTTSTSADITGIGGGTARTAGDAVYITTDTSAGTSITGDFAVDVTTVAGGSLQAGRYGIYVSHAGQKGVKITSGAAIDSTSRGINVSMTNAAAGKLDITTSGTINAGEWGIFAVTSGTGTATITTGAAITAAAGGVGLQLSGTSGDSSITVNGTVTANGAPNVGVYTYRQTGTGNISITTNAQVDAAGDGVRAQHGGSGDITIDVNARVISRGTTAGYGAIRARMDSTSGGNVAVSASGDVEAAGYGVHVVNNGQGQTTVTLGSATGANSITGINGTGNATRDDAIYVQTGTSAGTSVAGDYAVDVQVNTAGSAGGLLEAGQDGIDIDHAGKKGVRVASTAQIKASQDGINVDMTNAAAGKLDITSAGAIDAGAWGIYARTQGNGTATINVTAQVDAGSGGTGGGVGLIHSGTGDAAITANATVTAQGTGTDDVGLGIHHTGAGNAVITANADVTANQKAIGISHQGSGTVTVNTAATATLTSNGSDAISIDAGSSVTSVTVTAQGALNATGGDGVYVKYDGTGNATVHTKGAITTTSSGDGVFITHDANGNDTIIADARVNAAGSGLAASKTSGTGDITITANADITASGTGVDDAALYASHGGTGDIDITANRKLDAQNIGIFAKHGGSGDIDINLGANASIIARGADATDAAIYAELSKDSGANIEVLATAGAVPIQAQNIGLLLVNNGTGYVNVDLQGSITGIGGAGFATTDDAIRVVNDATAGTVLAAGQTVAVDITTSAGGLLEAGKDGIDIDHAGKGDVKLTSAAEIKAGQDGINVDMSNADAGSLTITSSGQITADRSGIHAVTSGKGNADVTVTGDVVASGNGSTTARGVSIEHKGDTGNTTLRVDGAVTFNGADADEVAVVAARSSGTSGNVDMTLNGTVDSKSTGVAAYTNLTDTGNITITQNAGATIKAGNSGILVSHKAKGDVRIISNAQVQADGTRPATDYAIVVDHTGATGNIDVQVKGGIIFNSTDSNEVAVYASRSSGSTGNVSVTIDSTITSNTHGVFAENKVTGNGTTTITQNAAITAGNHGIVAGQDATGDITIDSRAQITADGSGIGASHAGQGGIDIDTTSKIVAKGANTNDAGILAQLSTDDGTNIDVLARGDIEAKNIGVYLVNDGKGKTTFRLDSGKSITGIGGAGFATTDDAIRVVNDATAGTALGAGQTVAVDITTTAGGVLEAGKDGIDIDHAGEGDVKLTSAAEIKAGQDGINVSMTNANAGRLTIDSDAKITTTGGHGIDVSTAGTDATIDVSQQITAGRSGVRLVHSGNAGTSSITTSAAIIAAEEGIVLNVQRSAADATITTTAAVQGGKNGMYAAHNGGGNLNITTSADITGGTGYAIYAATLAGKTTTLNINGGTVSATSGIAILNNDGDSTINLAAASTVKGQIKLGDGSDVLNVNGADVSGVTLFDGGDDTSTADGFIDRLNFDNITLNNLDPARVRNWEQFNLNNGTSLHFSSGTMQVGEVVVAASSRFSFAGSSVTVTGSMNNQGTITAQNNANGDVLTINGDYAGNGTVKLDVKLDDGTVDTTDKLVIKGDNNGTIVVDVQNVGGAGGNTGTGPTDGIQVVDIQGTNNGSLQLVGGQIIVGMYAYSLTNDGYLQSTLAATPAMTASPSMAFFLPGTMESMFQRFGSVWRMAPTASGGGVRSAGFTITPTAATPLDLASGFWLRGRYRYLNADANASVGATPFNPTSKLHQLRVELGYTHLLGESAAGRLSGSIFTHYRRTSMNMESGGSERGTARADGFGGGVSLTWIGAEGLYADLLAELGRHRTTFTDKELDTTGKTWATTWRVSLEGGYRVPLDGHISLVPQAQVNVRGSKFRRYTVGSFTYEDHTRPVVTGRIGLGAEMAPVAVAEDLDITAQLTASLLHDFGKGGYMSANGQKIEADYASTLVELRSNLTALVPDTGMAFFLENSFRHSLKGPKQYALTSSIGLRLSF